MKSRYLFILLVFISLIAGLNLASAQSSNENCNPTISLINQDPNPAEPNSYVKLLFEVSTLDNCNGFTVKLMPKYPFSLDPGYDPLQSWDSNAYASGYKQVFVAPYKVRIAGDALEGEYKINLAYNVGNNNNIDNISAIKEFDVTLSDVQTNFDAVLQDISGTQISIGIVNTGKHIANSLVVKVPEQNNYRTSGVSGQIVGNLEAGDYTLVSFNVAPKMVRGANATSNENPLYLEIFYTDSIGERRNVTKEVSLGESITQQGNFSGTFTNRQANMAPGANTGLSYGWYLLGGAAVALLGWIVYKKYGSHVRKSHGKGPRTPEWVTSERSNEGSDKR